MQYKEQFNEYANLANQLGYNINFMNISKLKTTDVDRRNLITSISNRYCDSTNEFERDECMAALIILFWGEIKKLQSKLTDHELYSFEDCIQHLYVCIQVAMDYRGWKDGSCNAEQCIRRTIGSRGAGHLNYISNLDKNRANCNTMKIVAKEEYNDNSFIKEDKNYYVLEDTFTEKDNTEASSVRNLIQYYINNDKLSNAIILDRVAFSNTTVFSEEGSTVFRKFSSKKLKATLNKLNKEYYSYFLNYYVADPQKLQQELTIIHNLSLQQLTNKVNSTIKLLSVDNYALKNILCVK